MVRTCSKCGDRGHNSRTCWSTAQYYRRQQLNKPKERRASNSSLRLFGVQLDHHDLSYSSSSSSSVSVISRKEIKRKRRSMDYCNSWSSSTPRFTSCLSEYQANIGINRHDEIWRINNGGLQETNYNKGLAWSEEEHRKFLEGIEKLGRGDWRDISKHYVTTRTPTRSPVMPKNIFSDFKIVPPPTLQPSTTSTSTSTPTRKVAEVVPALSM